jgi:hypothetical protein
VELQPGNVPFRCNLALALQVSGQTAAGRAEFDRALEMSPTWPRAAARAAWPLATHPEARRRDGLLALQLAWQACLATGHQQPELLDALAAAWAEVGQFDQAVPAARKAAELAVFQGQPDLAGRIQARLRLYEKRQPYREGAGSRDRSGEGIQELGTRGQP